MLSFELPEFQMSLPDTGVSPLIDTIEEDMWRWLEAQRLVNDAEAREHLARTRPFYATSRYYPTAPLDRLIMANRLVALAFIIDDAFDDAISSHDYTASGRLCDELIDVSYGRTVGVESTVSRVLAELLDTFGAGRSREWRYALGHANAEWVTACRVEAQLTGRKRSMSLGAYIPHRGVSVDEPFFMHLTEYIQDIDLLPHIRDLPAMQQARARACEWIGLHNDIFSADKEQAVDYLFNAVLIIHQQSGRTLQEAADLVNDILTGLLDQFRTASSGALAQAAAITDPADTSTCVDQTRAVLEGYQTVIRGNYDYHFGTRRYTDALSYMPQARRGNTTPRWTVPNALITSARAANLAVRTFQGRASQ